MKPPRQTVRMQEQPGQEDGVKGSPPSVIGFGKKKEGDEEVRMLLKMIIQSQDDLKDKIHGTSLPPYRPTESPCVVTYALFVDISGQNEYLEREPLQVGNIEEFNSAISELRGAFRCLDNNWRSHKTELLDALRIVQQVCSLISLCSSIPPRRSNTDPGSLQQVKISKRMW